MFRKRDVIVKWARALYFSKIRQSRGVPLFIAAIISACAVSVLGADSNEIIGKLTSPDFATLASVFFRNHYPTTVPVTIVDIDDRTHEAWGSPATTPIEALFAIIEKLYPLGPTVIVVDVDLAVSSASEVASLASALDRFAEASARLAVASPLLLVRRLRPDDQRGEGAAYLPAAHPAVEAAVNIRSNAFWVSALLTPEDDFTFRKWRPFHALCTEMPIRGIPSAALAAEVIRREGIQALPALNQRLSLKANEICRGEATASNPGLLKWLQLPNYAIPIPYFFGWSAPTRQQLQTTDTKNGRRPLLIRVSAREVETASVLGPDSIMDRVVIIGSSYADSQDFYRTALGTMPGTYIIANTVAGARDMLDARFSPRTMVLLFRIPFFSLCAFSTIIVKSEFGVAAVAIMTLFAVGFGLFLSWPTFVIQDGVITGLAMLGIFLIILGIGGFLLSLRPTDSGRNSIFNILLSDAGKRLIGRVRD